MKCPKWRRQCRTSAVTAQEPWMKGARRVILPGRKEGNTMIRAIPYILVLVLGISTPAAAATFYVSKLGDNSDGTSWVRAFTTIQRALDAIPDDKGGHQIVIRPDTYMEANLFPAHKGAKDNPNILCADFDGSQGSGARGYAVIDSSDPERGLKAVDWWSPFKANPEFSGIGWDRWVIRRLYTTGGDAGLFWDLPPKIEPFSITVEDSVGIGRAFGGGVAHFLARPDEPIVFQRCQLWCLDWWGDASGAYVRAENTSMPERPDIFFNDCTLVGPDNALQSGNPGFATYSKVSLKNSRLISLNFSQPRGTPGTGVIYATIHGKFLHVDIENCTLAGYKIFGAKEGDITYTTRGSVRAYAQFEQPVPTGMITLGAWPVEAFQSILPAATPASAPILRKEPFILPNMVEVSPVIWNGAMCLLLGVRPAAGGTADDYWLEIRDMESGDTLATFGKGYGLCSAFVHDGTFYAYASHFENGNWNDVTVFWSRDLKEWQQQTAIEQESEHLFNSSVAAHPGGYVMAYETNDPKYPAFTIKFATSGDLKTWTKVDGAIFGTDRYTACPWLHYTDGYYYMIYLEHRRPLWRFESYLARSKDLVTWELAPSNPVLKPALDDEGINTSDVDVLERDDKTFVYYNVGDQRTWGNVKLAVYDGPIGEWLKHYFASPAPAH